MTGQCIMLYAGYVVLFVLLATIGKMYGQEAEESAVWRSKYVDLELEQAIRESEKEI